MTTVTTSVFLAISDPTRRAVLDLLATGSRKAGDIAARFRHLTQPAVSRHLKVLREAGLVNVEVNAQQRIYELKPEGLTELYEWVAKYQAMWPDTLEALERYLDARAVRQSRRGRSDDERNPSNGSEVPAREASGGLNMHRQVSRHADPGDRVLVTTPHSSRAGTLTFEGDYATISFERRIRHPIQVVWEALTESEHLARWYMTRAHLEAREGGSIDYWSGPAQYHVTGKILTWQPPRVFEHEWNVEPRK